MSFRYWIFQFLLRKVQTPSIAEASDTLDIVLEPQQRSKITCLKKNIYMEYSKPKARNKLTICNQVCEHILATSCDWIVSISKNISYFVQIWPAAPHSSMFALYTLWGVLTSQKKKKKIRTREKNIALRTWYANAENVILMRNWYRAYFVEKVTLLSEILSPQFLATRWFPLYSLYNRVMAKDFIFWCWMAKG